MNFYINCFFISWAMACFNLAWPKYFTRMTGASVFAGAAFAGVAYVIHSDALLYICQIRRSNHQAYFGYLLIRSQDLLHLFRALTRFFQPHQAHFVTHKPGSLR